MKCRNEFCIYEKNGKCILEKIELDITGTCEDCIYADIPTRILEYKKDELRRKYEKLDSGR